MNVETKRKGRSGRKSIEDKLTNARVWVRESTVKILGYNKINEVASIAIENELNKKIKK